ncbi:MAG: dTDP-4-dehydrorhamnose reductase [Deltaproteobacteria bacterium]|nr:dTDP-4-dehydrorhamnose reductase [Deltaproteobacteria bacterium]
MPTIAPKILITGRDGQLGQALCRTLSPLGPLTAWGRQEADFLKPSALENKLSDLKPTVIVNAAAWTKVDLAQCRPNEARLVNADSPVAISAWARDHEAFFIHYSTDYVFDGSKASPYTELDSPNPLNLYGQTKLEGDLGILNNLAQGYVFRTSWVFSPLGASFPKTILRLAKSQAQLTVNDDQTGAPTSADFLAALTALAIRDHLQDRPHPHGLYNLSCSGQTTWLGYATYLLHSAKLQGLALPQAPTLLLPAYGPDPDRPAKRPLNSLLDTTKIQLELNITCPPWQSEVDKFLTYLQKVDPQLKYFSS